MNGGGFLLSEAKRALEASRAGGRAGLAKQASKSKACVNEACLCVACGGVLDKSIKI